MPATKSLKASDKQNVLKKLITELKKRYGNKVPKQNRSVLETLLFAACLEDSAFEEAETAYENLLNSFFDLNEIRVSSVTEVAQSLKPLEEPEWKAMRLRESLQHTFEKHFAFDLEQLRRKTQDAALKELQEIPYQTVFMRLYTANAALGAHTVPVDAKMLQVLRWCGLVDAEATEEAAADELKSPVKKSDSPQIIALLKAVSTDPEIRWAFEEIDADAEFDPFDSHKRLADLFKNPNKPKPAKKATRKSTTEESKSVTKKKPVKKKTTRRATAADDTKQAADRTKSTKSASKTTTPAEKTATKKKTSKKTVVKKVTKKKPAAKAVKKRTKKS